MSQQQVTFRRINGRIVPISSERFSNEDRRKKAAIGAWQVTAGAAIAAAPGYAAAKLVKKSHEFRVKSMIMRQNQQAIGVAAGMAQKGKHLNRAAATTRLISQKMFKARNPLLIAGAIGGGALLGEGIHRLHEAVTGEKQGKMKEKSIGYMAGTVAAATYYKFLPVVGLRKIIQNTIAWVKGKPRPHKADWYA